MSTTVNGPKTPRHPGRATRGKLAIIVAVVALAVPAAVASGASSLKFYGCALDRFTTDPTNALRFVVSSSNPQLARVYCNQWEKALDTLSNPVDLFMGIPLTAQGWPVQLCVYANRSSSEIVEVWSTRTSSNRMLAAGVCRSFTASAWRKLRPYTSAIAAR